MGRTGRAALVAAAGLFLAGGLHAQSAPGTNLRRTTVTVIDRLGLGQQEETIAVYFAGVLAGTLHVDAAHPDDSFIATIPLQDKLGFTLCGKLMRREADGSLTPHPIDNGGTLAGYEGARLAALTMGDVLFSLEDEAGQAESTVQQGPACTAAVS
jgi:hypothetical protein